MWSPSRQFMSGQAYPLHFARKRLEHLFELVFPYQRFHRTSFALYRLAQAKTSAIGIGLHCRSPRQLPEHSLRFHVVQQPDIARCLVVDHFRLLLGFGKLEWPRHRLAAGRRFVPYHQECRLSAKHCVSRCCPAVNQC